MKVIVISKKKFDGLTKLMLSREIFNTEAVMFDMEYRNQRKVLKNLYNLNGAAFANKLYTLEMLDSNKGYLPGNFVVPDCLCSVNGEIVGFTVPYVEGTNLASILQNPKIDYKEQLYFLKRVGVTLEQLKSIRTYTPLKNIFINDLHASNFIVNPNSYDLFVIDLDSCKIGENKAFPARFLTPASLTQHVPTKYQVNMEEEALGYIIPNEDSDLYCYNIMILNYLFGANVGSLDLEEFYEYLFYLEGLGVNKELTNTFLKVVTNCQNENPIELIDSLTNEQIYRAKKSVYEHVHKKVIV